MLDVTLPIADYEPIESLGAGSHGECVAARPPTRLGLAADRVVVKVLATPASAEASRRVAAELALIAAVDTASLVPLYDAGEQRGSIFTVSALCAGGSLAAPGTPPSRTQILCAVADAARAAHALHEAGIAHRAIKPSNVMLGAPGGRETDAGGRVTDVGGQLTDVGLAHLLSPGQTVTGIGPVDDLEFTEPGALLGRPASRAFDIWSLAVTLHRALTATSVYGEPPTRDVFGALRHVLETPPTISAELTDGEAALLSWCLRAERGERPATAALVADALDALAEDAA